MSVRLLAWYLSGLMSLTWVLFSLVTMVPDAESERIVAVVICAVGAVLFAIGGLFCGWFSAQHWINRSRILQSVLLALAIGLTLFLLVGVIG